MLEKTENTMKIVNPETLETLDTQDTRRRQSIKRDKTTHKAISNKDPHPQI